MTQDRVLDTAGIADLADGDWRIRVLAVRDMVRLARSGNAIDAKTLVGLLDDDSAHVRYLAAMSLGIVSEASASAPLQLRLAKDPTTTVRSQAAISLGQIGLESSLPALEKALSDDSSRDVTHQCELAIYQIRTKQAAGSDLAEAWSGLEESTFDTVATGTPAPDFELKDTEGNRWKLSEHRGKTVALVWVFADWCPVCHGEFNDLMELEETFSDEKVEVVTVEIHDRFRCRVMVGKELEPHYWFSKESFKEAYTQKIWWPHLSDLAGAVGAQFGIDPLAFAVHSEYINRPATIIIDPEGVVRFTYFGTFWGDRPSIHDMLKIIRSKSYDFRHPRRLEFKSGE